MRITSVKVLLSGQGLVKAKISITIDNAFLLRGITVVANKSTGELDVRMPIRKKSDGKIHEYFHPVNKETRSYMRETILQAYEQVLKDPNSNIIWLGSTEEIPEISDIKVMQIENDRLVKALATIVLDHAIVVNQLRIIHDPTQDRTWIAMPAKRIAAEGEDEVAYLEYCHPIKQVCREAITEAILQSCANTAPVSK